MCIWGLWEISEGYVKGWYIVLIDNIICEYRGMREMCEWLLKYENMW